ncbi:prostate stem cell antigen isoform X2 [Microcaecilia unicolor]|uniref:Prostate stem cell antigen-like isoform X2 n=1 Tax=Microcaecilia unicolor TaxID=1415580 RepID=A0A6P7ZEH9_9AMPH|nr:prostate stem cell antigen-like isoform X2 [Microcaecilia unicolor]
MAQKQLGVIPTAFGHQRSASARKCHSCKGTPNVTECDMLPVETCHTDKPFCIISNKMTVISFVTFHSKVTITKGCANEQECTTENSFVWLSKENQHCCSYDLCNDGDGTNGGKSTEQSRVLLAVALALALLKMIL